MLLGKLKLIFVYRIYFNLVHFTEYFTHLPQDVTHMSNLVHQLYKEACESLQESMKQMEAQPGTLTQR